MSVEQITIRVDSEAARTYREAGEEDRRKLDLLLSLRLRDVMHAPGPLKDLMRDIGRKAQQRGMTPQILREILDER